MGFALLFMTTEEEELIDKEDATALNTEDVVLENCKPEVMIPLVRKVPCVDDECW